MNEEEISTSQAIVAYLTAQNGADHTEDVIIKKTGHGKGVVRLALAEMQITGQVQRISRIGAQARFYVKTDEQREAEQRANKARDFKPLRLDPHRIALHAELQAARDAIPSLHARLA